MTAMKIPIVDLGRLTSSGNNADMTLEEKDYENVGEEIKCALHDIGFMYLINHGIPDDVIHKNFEISKQFFELPTSSKRKYKKNLEVNRNGWVEPGQELLHEDSNFEYRECFDITAKGPIFPNEVTSFKVIHDELQKRCKPLIRIVLRLLAFSLNLNDKDYFIKRCCHLNNSAGAEIANECDFSMIYYPPIFSDTKLPEDTVRCAEHTDYEIMTLLFQNHVGGLEIKNACGQWISADPIPNAILVNTGDLLEIWTSKYYKATLHRVIVPKTEEEKKQARYSFAYFIAPDDATLIKPLTQESTVINEYILEARLDDAYSKDKNDSVCSANENLIISAHDHIMKRVYTAYGYNK